MPLVKGPKASTRKGFSENIKKEMKTGKTQKQAVAIAYSEARRGKKDREDESLGERRGKESSKKQSYKSRRDESKGSKRK